MSAALRTTQATPSMRSFGAAFGAIVIAGALVGLLALAQVATPVTGHPARRSAVFAPSVALAAPVLNDRGWATAPSVALAAPVLNDRGWATDSSAGSYSAGKHRGSGGSNGTRFPQ
jgi:hypothetical protein